MIKVENLSLSANKLPLISGLNINFNQGEFWAILGNNGTGKSSLLASLAGFRATDEGRIFLNDKSLSAFNALSRAQHISYLTQETEASLNCTVRQNLSYARYPWQQHKTDKHKDKAIIQSVMEIMQLQHLRDKYIQQISGGELRKVEIATALVQDSEILMLDEPLNHLDLAFRIKLMQHLQQLSRNKVIIMVTHDIQYVQKYCSNVIMILNDRQTIHGSVNTTLTQQNLNTMLGIPVPEFIKNT